VCGLYIIRHRNSGKEYVGKSINVRQRLGRHQRRANSSIFLSRAIAAYGIDAFDCCIYATGTDAEMLDLEMTVIAARGCISPGGYNLTAGGEGVSGYKMTAEQIAKVSAAGRGKARSAETRARMAEANRQRPPEHWEKVAAKTRARVVSEETRAKQSKHAKSRTPEHLARIAAANSGKTATTAAREAMRLAKIRAVWAWPPGALLPLEFASCNLAAAWARKNPASISNYCNGKTSSPCGTQYAYVPK
jgi:group I intron endonuclease